LQWACGAGEEGGGSTPSPPALNEDPTQDYTTFEVEWADDAFVLDDLSEVQGALLAADYEAGELVFSPELAGLAELQVDRVGLIGGVGFFRVIARESVDAGELIRVEEVPLTEVIENGTIAWRRSFLSAEEDAKLGLGIDEDQVDTVRSLKQPLGTFEPGKLTYSGKISGFDVDFSLTKQSAGLDLSLSTKYKAANAVASAAVKGTVYGLTNETSIVVEGHSLKYFTVKFLDVEGDLEIEAGGVEFGLADLKLQVPARLALPVVIGGIPFYVEVGGSAEWSSTLTTNTSAIFKGKTRYKGGVGVRVNEGDVRLLATFVNSEVELGEREHVGTVTAGMGFLMNFPELRVGVGPRKVAEASATFRFKSEAVSNFLIEYGAAGGVPVITGNCLSSRVNFGATLSQGFTFVGVTLSEKEQTLFSKLGAEKKSGEACE